MQFLFNVFCRIIAHMQLVAGREQRTDLRHLLLHLLGEAQLIGGLLRLQGKVDRVEPVDAVVGLGCLLLMLHLHQLAQVDQLPLLAAQQDRLRIKACRLSVIPQSQPDPPLLPGRILLMSQPQELLPVMPTDRLLDGRQSDA